MRDVAGELGSVRRRGKVTPSGHTGAHLSIDVRDDGTPHLYGHVAYRRGQLGPLIEQACVALGGELAGQKLDPIEGWERRAELGDSSELRADLGRTFAYGAKAWPVGQRDLSLDFVASGVFDSLPIASHSPTPAPSVAARTCPALDPNGKPCGVMLPTARARRDKESGAIELVPKTCNDKCRQRLSRLSRSNRLASERDRPFCPKCFNDLTDGHDCDASRSTAAHPECDAAAAPNEATPPTEERCPIEPRDRSKPAAPPFKWLGGKRWLVPDLLGRIPTKIGTYYEPFCGGGAIFWALTGEPSPRFDRAVLADANLRLVRTYRALQEDPEAIIRLLASYPDDKATFDELRASDVDSDPNDPLTAAWLIYLQCCGHGAVYRVNGSGGYNVPRDKSRKERPILSVNADNLRACSRALQGVDIRHGDFAACVADAKPGDLVFLDPPYRPASRTADFTGYTADGFGPAEHVRLRDLAKELMARGVHVALSNSDNPEVRGLYADPAFNVIPVTAPRRINRKLGHAMTAAEVLIVGTKETL